METTHTDRDGTPVDDDGGRSTPRGLTPEELDRELAIIEEIERQRAEEARNLGNE